MSKLDDLVVFAQVAELGSFTEAAKRFGIGKAAVSKQISRLENRLGAQLLQRTTRHLSLTEAGLQVLPHAQRILEELGGIEDAVSGLQSRPSGVLRVSAPVAVGNKYLSALGPLFQKLYPEVELVVILNDRHVDIVAEGFDLSIRLTDAPPENWRARILKRVEYCICATPAYWERCGPLITPEDLVHHRVLLNRESGQQVWRLKPKQAVAGRLSTWVEQPVKGSLVINTSEGLRAAVLQGQSIALLPDYAIDEDIRSGRLAVGLMDYEVDGPFGSQLYALYAPNRYLAPKTRAFIDFLLERFSEIES
jgi:DNA-binding transcriptional LysR family regulator